MRTLTEFSGTIIRMAANAVAQVRKSLPPDAFKQRVPAPPAEEVETAHPHDNASKPAPDTGVDSATDAADERLAADAVSHIPASAEPKPPPFKAGEAGTSERGSHSDPDTQFRKEEAVAGKDLAGQAQDVGQGRVGQRVGRGDRHRPGHVRHAVVGDAVDLVGRVRMRRRT